MKSSEWNQLILGNAYKKRYGGNVDLSDAANKIREYYKKEGRKPTVNSTNFFLSDGTSASQLNQALSGGHRGLKKGSSLSKFADGILGTRNRSSIIDIKKAKKQIKKYFEKNKKKPSQQSKDFFLADGTSAGAFDAALRHGRRGLKKRERGLADLCGETLGLPSQLNQPKLSKKIIKKELMNYMEKYGNYPTCRSKKTLSFDNGTTWEKVNYSLVRGYRGLKEGASLKSLIQEVVEELENNIRNEKQL